MNYRPDLGCRAGNRCGSCHWCKRVRNPWVNYMEAA